MSKDQRVGPVALAEAEAARADGEEHWRLLYVAMTRAEEALFIGGSLGPRHAKNGPHEDSWYARLKPVFPDEALEDDIWGARWERSEPAPPVPLTDTGKAGESQPDLPDWAKRPAPEEPRPPRPLAPSGLGEQEGSDPPLPPDHAAGAARRGVLIHALLERLPAVAPEERRERATDWLAKQAPDLAEADRSEMLDNALAVIERPDFAAVFGPDALAEVPLAALVEGRVVTGIADRLLVTEDAVTVIDFKTARRPPTALEDVPDHTLRQMAAYVAALEAIYPGQAVRAALLYTQTPQLIELPPATLAAYKTRFADPQESFALPPVE